jgi:hypothetical protein
MSVGVLVGVAVGVRVGVFVGVLVGVSVGVLVGVAVGVSVGVAVGVSVGVAVGVSVGVAVGVGVGGLGTIQSIRVQSPSGSFSQTSIMIPGTRSTGSEALAIEGAESAKFTVQLPLSSAVT